MKESHAFRAWMILFISFHLFQFFFKWSHGVREWNSSITTSLNHHSLKFISGSCFLVCNKKKSAWSREIYKRSSWCAFLALSPCLRGKIPTKRVFRGSWNHSFHENHVRGHFGGIRGGYKGNGMRNGSRSRRGIYQAHLEHTEICKRFKLFFTIHEENLSRFLTIQAVGRSFLDSTLFHRHDG